MQPKTKLEKEVVGMKSKLPPLSEHQRAWAIRNVFPHVGRKLKGKLNCLDCGHEINAGDADFSRIYDKNFRCPACGMKLTIAENKTRVYSFQENFGIITTYKGFQVMRVFSAFKWNRLGEPAKVEIYEVVQHWIRRNGTAVNLSRLHSSFFFSSSRWNLSSDLEVRRTFKERFRNVSDECIYPYRRYIPELKRNGFSGDFHDIEPCYFLEKLLSNSKVETLLKAGQFILMDLFLREFDQDKYWPSVKICLRNGYQVKDAILWKDYINLLMDLDKDVRNAKYVCPADLRFEHDRMVALKREMQLRMERMKLLKSIDEQEKVYQKMKERYLGIEFSDNELHVKVLQSVHEFLEEGDELHHCVFTNKYHLEKDSLIMSARVNGKRMETVEVSLRDLKVVQSQGVFNHPTEYHDRIIGLVRKNIDTIRASKRKHKKEKV